MTRADKRVVEALTRHCTEVLGEENTAIVIKAGCTNGNVVLPDLNVDLFDAKYISEMNLFVEEVNEHIRNTFDFSFKSKRFKSQKAKRIVARIFKRRQAEFQGLGYALNQFVWLMNAICYQLNKAQEAAANE